jgi:serine/threonine-protein kinase
MARRMEMLNNKIILMLSVLVAATTISCMYMVDVAIKHTTFEQRQQQTTTNFSTYDNSTYGIRIQYPSDWDKEENGTRQHTVTDVVTFFPSSSSTNASLDISIDDISDEMGTSLAQYASDSISDYKGSFANFNLIESSSSTNNNNNILLGGLPAYRLTYTYTDQNNNFKDTEIGAIKDNKVYILTYEAGLSEYNKYLPIVQNMVNSFQITK